MRRALNVVKRIFTVRSCNYDMPKQMPERPCLDYYIKRCKAPCILAQTQGEYRGDDRRGARLPRGHARTKSCARVRERMELAAESLDFERAARAARRAARISSRWKSRRSCMEVEGGDRDVVGYARDGDDAVRRADAHSRRQAAGARASVPREHRRTRPTPTCSRRISPARTCRSRSARDELLVPFDLEERELRRGVARAHEDPRAAARSRPRTGHAATTWRRAAAAGSWASSRPAAGRLATSAWRRSRWKYWAGVVQLATRMLPSAQAAGSARGARWSARGPSPRSRAAAAASAGTSAPHLASPETRNWSTITWAEFTKSPNCASHSTSASGPARCSRTRSRRSPARTAGCCAARTAPRRRAGAAGA